MGFAMSCPVNFALQDKWEACKIELLAGHRARQAARESAALERLFKGKAIETVTCEPPPGYGEGKRLPQPTRRKLKFFALPRRITVAEGLFPEQCKKIEELRAADKAANRKFTRALNAVEAGTQLLTEIPNLFSIEDDFYDSKHFDSITITEVSEDQKTARQIDSRVAENDGHCDTFESALAFSNKSATPVSNQYAGEKHFYHPSHWDYISITEVNEDQKSVRRIDPRSSLQSTFDQDLAKLFLKDVYEEVDCYFDAVQEGPLCIPSTFIYQPGECGERCCSDAGAGGAKYKREEAIKIWGEEKEAVIKNIWGGMRQPEIATIW